MKITVKDIARVANVSQPTVSRVLNNHPGVKEDKRRRVLNAIQQLDFTPDSVARSMITNKTNTLGLIVGDISNPFFAESAKLIISKAQELGYDVIISNTDHNDNNLEHAITTLISKRVDGIIISSVNRNSTKIRELYDDEFPVVLYNSRVKDGSSHFVVLDNKQGAIIAVNHLVNLRHRKIGFISGPTKYFTIYDRYAGYKEALKRYGIRFNKEFVYEGELSYDKIYDFSYRLLKRKDRPTAFFATSDQMALAVMDAATKCEIDIPKELSVIGFDNASISANEYIGLTTISQQKEKMALLALDKLLLLIGRTEYSSSPIQVTLSPELIVRKTTATASGGD